VPVTGRQSFSGLFIRIRRPLRANRCLSSVLFRRRRSNDAFSRANDCLVRLFHSAGTASYNGVETNRVRLVAYPVAHDSRPGDGRPPRYFPFLVDDNFPTRLSGVFLEFTNDIVSTYIFRGKIR